jgi:hypothetical protein
MALQIGCSGTAGDRGAFAFQPGEGGALAPDAFATSQAVPGIAGAPLPIDPSNLAASLPGLDCSSPVDTGGGSVATTTSTTSISGVASAGTTTASTIPETGASGPGHGVVPSAVTGTLLVLAGLSLIAAARRPGRQR